MSFCKKNNVSTLIIPKMWVIRKAYSVLLFLCSAKFRPHIGFLHHFPLWIFVNKLNKTFVQKWCNFSHKLAKWIDFKKIMEMSKHFLKNNFNIKKPDFQKWFHFCSFCFFNKKIVGIQKSSLLLKQSQITLLHKKQTNIHFVIGFSLSQF